MSLDERNAPVIPATAISPSAFYGFRPTQSGSLSPPTYIYTRLPAGLPPRACVKREVNKSLFGNINEHSS